ncbi:MAG: stage sporulation protein [Clostridiales bacterium]|jgi:stage III sporulation protein AE|nr:stage sporulation protein [Clostridiales bacterium]MDK2934498.1 stage sporulation protein [Clostridiales bacterium]
MKKILIFIIVFLTFLIIPTWADNEQKEIIDEQYKTVNVKNIENFTNKVLDPQTQQVIPDFNVEKVTKDLSLGKLELNMKAIFERILRFFMKEVYLNIKIMLQLVVLTIICGILTNLQSSFGREGVGEVAFFACYIFLIGVMIKSFTYAVDVGREVIDNMVMFMQSMVPTLMTLLISTGNITSASIFQPAILFSVQIIGSVIKNFLIPILFFATALSMVNNISDKFHVTKLVDFLQQLAKWSLGILLTGFIGVITVQGLASSVVDGIGSKTAKFAVGNFIPIVGGILSDAVDTVIGCSLILKNAVGIVGLIIIILICLVPVIKILALIIIYRLTGAVIEPVSDKRIVQCISDLGNSLTLIFAMVVSVAVMFLLSITIVVGAGNVSAMLR